MSVADNPEIPANATAPAVISNVAKNLQLVRSASTDGQPALRPHLVVPYTLDSNDMRFAALQGFNSGTQFFDYLKDAFDVLYAEGDPDGLNRPKMLSIGLHCRIVGRPARGASIF